MKSWDAVPSAALEPSPGQVALYDSRSSRTVPVGRNGHASMYVCGITPYDATHLGHAATYLAFDLANRVWRDAGFVVSYVQNVTDIDDPLLERAQKVGQDWREIARRETELFFTDMQALRVLPPNHYESAVESIPDVVELIHRLRDSVAYQVDGDWYFHSDRVGAVCGWDRAQMVETFAQRGGDPAREGKRDALDSLLWLAARPNEPSWDSSLGSGRPGWHIECVAIAMRYLAMPLNVQGGGRDLVFPHHDMCNAQVEAITGNPLADAFVHAGLIGYQGEKMSKSLGNLVLVSQLRERGVDMSALRLALAQGHYRSDREWDEALLAKAQQRLELWRACADRDASEILSEVRAALRDDLNTPDALHIIDTWCHFEPLAPRVSTDTANRPTLRVAVDALLGVVL